jgi:hypothetical protein
MAKRINKNFLNKDHLYNNFIIFEKNKVEILSRSSQRLTFF